MTRILIADDHTMFREGLRRVLEADSTLEIVGEAKDGVEVIQLSAKLKPQVLLLDMQMPKQTGLESLPEIARLVPQARIIFLTAAMDTNETREALRIGALPESTGFPPSCVPQSLARCQRKNYSGTRRLRSRRRSTSR